MKTRRALPMIQLLYLSGELLLVVRVCLLSTSTFGIDAGDQGYRRREGGLNKLYKRTVDRQWGSDATVVSEWFSVEGLVKQQRGSTQLS